MMPARDADDERTARTAPHARARYFIFADALCRERRCYATPLIAL